MEGGVKNFPGRRDAATGRYRAPPARVDQNFTTTSSWTRSWSMLPAFFVEW